MNDTSRGKIQKNSLIPGKRNRLNVNKPVRFEIETAGGTLITGIVTPNNPLDVTPANDIVNYNVYIEDDILGYPPTEET